MADINQLSDWTQLINIAENLEENVRNEIAQNTLRQIEADKSSRMKWFETSQEYLELAAQVKTSKNHPWPKSSNVKYPLLTIAATQFHARAQQSLINESGMVKTKVIGRDPDGMKRARGERIAQYLTYQLVEEMCEWIDDMDRLLLLLPLCGICHKKTYYSVYKNRTISELIIPQDLIISYYARDLKTARKTHIIELSPNEIIEYMRGGIYLDTDYGNPNAEKHRDKLATNKIQELRPEADEEDVPYTMYESHTWYDLDGDGYKEPWIATINLDSGKLARLVPRFDLDDVEIVNKKVSKIPPKEYFTDFIFMPDPQSATHGIGLGHLIGPMNHSVNTIINQLTDAGTLSNLQSGFLGRGIKLPIGGNIRFKPGEWKVSQSTGDDLRKSVYPLPVREPSGVLFTLLELLVKAGENAGSIADIMLGENPGQNQPYSTTLAVIEQGQKVFIAIYKRLYRALKQEYKKLYKLNSKYLDPQKYINIVDDDKATEEDWNQEDYDICPSADPNSVSDLQKLKKAEGILGLVQLGTVNPQEATRRFLEALGEEDISSLMQLPPPQPNFDQQVELQKAKNEEFAIKAQMLKDFTQAMKNMSAAHQTEAETELLPGKHELEKIVTAMDAWLKMGQQESDNQNAEADRQLKEKEIAAQAAQRSANAGTNG